MPLPVLSQAAAVSDADRVRLFHRTEQVWAEQLGEAEQLDAGHAVCAADLATFWAANRVLTAAVPPGGTPEQVVAEVEAHYAARGARCLAWQLNPSAPAERVGPLAEHLLAAGYAGVGEDVMALAGPPGRAAFASPPGVTVLPARAAFRHARELAAEVSPDDPDGTEAQVRHLDDPHNDALLALRGGKAVGRVTVLAAGDVGRIDQVFVAEGARRQGIGRLLVGRALEICARSLFRHVLLSVGSDNRRAIALYQSLGFRKAGTIVTYRRVAADSR
jgi:ribosomal protein S18 acetylase RimI-like enzyme